MSHYNFVFFWGPQDYYRFAFSDIVDLSNVIYIPGVLANRSAFIKKLHSINHSAKINKVIRLPFRYSWRKHYFINSFSDDKPIIFVFHGSYYWMKSINYFSYLHEKYPNSKIVFALTDTVDSYIQYFHGKYYGEFDLEYLQKVSDAIFSYNMTDVVKYHLQYFPTIYSAHFSHNICKKNSLMNNDVFFIGKAKDRLPTILTAYRKLEQIGLTCDFYIVDVPKEKQLYPDKIVYNKYLSYDEVLNHIQNSNSILEIVQGGSDGLTFRDSECFAYDKNLITNNSAIKYTKYCHSPKIFTFNDELSINLNDFQNSVSLSYCYNNDFSPITFLTRIEEYFHDTKE